MPSAVPSLSAVPGTAPVASGRRLGAHRVRRVVGAAGEVAVDDVATIVGLIGRAHAESVYRALPYAPRKIAAAARRYAARPDTYALLLAEDRQAPIGLCVVAAENYVFSDAPGAGVLILYVTPPARGSLAALQLLRAARRWAKDRGAKLFTVHVIGGIRTDRTHKLLARLGFTLTGGNYVMRLAAAEAIAGPGPVTSAG